MALLIYKQWHRISYTKKGCAAASNAAHIQYIGERVHVLKNPDNENGLFGKICGQYNEHYDMKAIMKHIENVTRQNKTVFRSCISFTPEQAKALGLAHKSNWEKFVKYHVADIALKNNIKINNFDYVAAVHDKFGQPHVHICFWDRNQEVAVVNVNPELPNEIRKAIEKNEVAALEPELSFDTKTGEYSSEYCVDNGDEVRKQLISSAFKNEKNFYQDMQNMTYKEASEITANAMQELLNGALHEMPELLKAFDALDKIIPRKGSMNYGSKNIFPYHKDIDSFIQLLTDKIPILDTAKHEYRNATELIARMYNSNPYEIACHMGPKLDELQTKLGNAVLDAMLKNRKEHLSVQNYDRNTETESFHLSMGILVMFRVMRDFSTEANAQLNSDANEIFGRGDLSKDEIRNLLAKNRDKEMER